MESEGLRNDVSGDKRTISETSQDENIKVFKAEIMSRCWVDPERQEELFLKDHLKR